MTMQSDIMVINDLLWREFFIAECRMPIFNKCHVETIDCRRSYSTVNAMLCLAAHNNEMFNF